MTGSALLKPTDNSVAEPADEALLSVRNLCTYFPVRGATPFAPKRVVKAVDNLSLEVGRGKIVSIVGESGSGKTTAGRSILRLIEPTSGQVMFDGMDLGQLGPRALRDARRKMQIIFQDPFASLNPRMSIGGIIAEGLKLHSIGEGRADQRDRVAALLERVGLSADHMRRYPHEFSGGQRQRVGIARALAVEPDFILADEPVSALDVSIQAQVLNLLQDLREDLGLTMVFIAHDLSVVEYLSDRVAVMYLGRIMEIADARDLYANPQHPYTEALLSAAPIPEPGAARNRIMLKGETPSPIDPPSGCVFRTRCPIAGPECATTTPDLKPLGKGHSVACLKRG
ncbi:ABC transporter ATP-binding protein [Pararhodobacter oceanensis]|uniref:Peptide ABC transporter ATP-binding protein n=1 Tax=Pararhodobacter oceanensis TaxID=2172121 RepID=A0A2T8HWS0_9RHOB|nr:oligopeptide/dipeptide ABC transporter ATP-binding protein [Pararhodobacter oceanensis]PVH29848.1 peptide ABC transporter ATP-binding protein [Pararhodobacter oceanensis]